MRRIQTDLLACLECLPLSVSRVIIIMIITSKVTRCSFCENQFSILLICEAYLTYRTFYKDIYRKVGNCFRILSDLSEIT